MSRNFKEIREAKGLSQVQMAVKAGVSLRSIVMLEKGELNRLQPRVRIGISAAYGFDPVTDEPYVAEPDRTPSTSAA